MANRKTLLTKSDYRNFRGFASAIIADSAENGCALTPLAFAAAWFRMNGMPTARTVAAITSQYCSDLALQGPSLNRADNQILDFFVEKERLRVPCSFRDPS
jgi:hypothetical protein